MNNETALTIVENPCKTWAPYSKKDWRSYNTQSNRGDLAKSPTLQNVSDSLKINEVLGNRESLYLSAEETDTATVNPSPPASQDFHDMKPYKNSSMMEGGMKRLYQTMMERDQSSFKEQIPVTPPQMQMPVTPPQMQMSVTPPQMQKDKPMFYTPPGGAQGQLGHAGAYNNAAAMSEHMHRNGAYQNPYAPQLFQGNNMGKNQFALAHSQYNAVYPGVKVYADSPQLSYGKAVEKNDNLVNNPIILNEKSTSSASDMITLVQMLVSLSGFVAGAMGITLGIIHLVHSNPSLEFPKDFLSDVNAETWRTSLFSISPSVFIDTWTPLIFGVITMIVHLKPVNDSFLGMITKNYIFYAIWLVFQALWGNMGYRGGLGICIGIFTLVVAALSLLIGIAGGDANASILFDYQAYALTKDVSEDGEKAEDEKMYNV